MDEPTRIDIVTITYRSTHYYLLVSPIGVRLLVDCGWPGTFGTMVHELRRKDVDPTEIDYLLVTHFHPDHAGLVEEMRGLGAALLLVDLQVPHVETLSHYVKPGDGFRPIRTGNARIVSPADSRALLHHLGFDGEIAATPGHSPDSISLVLDEGIAFTGDLQPAQQSAPEDAATHESWRHLLELGVHRIYPAHGGTRTLR